MSTEEEYGLEKRYGEDVDGRIQLEKSCNLRSLVHADALGK